MSLVSIQHLVYSSYRAYKVNKLNTGPIDPDASTDEDAIGDHLTKYFGIAGFLLKDNDIKAGIGPTPIATPANASDGILDAECLNPTRIIAVRLIGAIPLYSYIFWVYDVCYCIIRLLGSYLITIVLIIIFHMIFFISNISVVIFMDILLFITLTFCWCHLAHCILIILFTRYLSYIFLVFSQWL